MQTFERLEKEFGEFSGYLPEQMVAVSSGTMALLVGLEALQLAPGTGVIMSDFNMIACPRAATTAGLKPVFVDCGHDLNIDHEEIWEHLKWAHHAILATHIYGRCCNMPEIASYARQRDEYVIEDMSEIHGVKPHPSTDVAAWSFYSNKVIAGAEGGMIAFKDPAKAKLARQLRSLGFTDAHDFHHIPRGVNARMSNAHAGLILNSFYYVQENLEDRKQIEGWYNEVCPIEWKMPDRESVWVFDLRIPGMGYAQQTRIVQALNIQGIAARHGFKPMTMQQEYATEHAKEMNHPYAYKAGREILYLPVMPGMTQADVVRNMDALKCNVNL